MKESSFFSTTRLVVASMIEDVARLRFELIDKGLVPLGVALWDTNDNTAGLRALGAYKALGRAMFLRAARDMIGFGE